MRKVDEPSDAALIPRVPKDASHGLQESQLVVVNEAGDDLARVVAHLGTHRDASDRKDAPANNGAQRRRRDKDVSLELFLFELGDDDDMPVGVSEDLERIFFGAPEGPDRDPVKGGLYC